jgi:hypothetical protein
LSHRLFTPVKRSYNLALSGHSPEFLRGFEKTEDPAHVPFIAGRQFFLLNARLLTSIRSTVFVSHQQTSRMQGEKVHHLEHQQQGPSSYICSVLL